LEGHANSEQASLTESPKQCKCARKMPMALCELELHVTRVAVTTLKPVTQFEKIPMESNNAALTSGIRT